MKLKLIASIIACSSMLIALPISVSASWRQGNQSGWNYRVNNNDDLVALKQIGQDMCKLNTNGNLKIDTILDGCKLDSNDGVVDGKIFMLNMNNTTGSAVSISFNSTTASAVSLSIDATTSPAVVVSSDNVSNLDDIVDEINKQEEKFNTWMKDFDDRISKQFEEMEKQEDKFWKLIHR